MSPVEDSNTREFHPEAEEILEAIADGLFSLEEESAGGEPDPEVINAVFHGAHSLKGISAMCGFTQITELSRKMETLLDAVRMGRVPCESRVADLLLRGADLLKRLCSRLAEGEGPAEGEVPSFRSRDALPPGRLPDHCGTGLGEDPRRAPDRLSD